MLTWQFIERLAETYDIDDILYILGKNRVWLLNKIRHELLEKRKEFFDGDPWYAEVIDDD